MARNAFSIPTFLESFRAGLNADGQELLGAVMQHVTDSIPTPGKSRKQVPSRSPFLFLWGTVVHGAR